MARTVEDVLSRRTRALLLDARESIRVAPVVAKTIALEMDKDENGIDSQLEIFQSVAANERREKGCPTNSRFKLLFL